VLNKTADGTSRNPNYSYYGSLRVLNVSGPVYCYEKGTGKRAWYTEKLFENQQLIVERFGELPALVSATHTAEEDENGVLVVGLGRGRANNGLMVYTVTVIDKVNGRIRFRANLNQQGGNFYAIQTDPRKAEARLIRNDTAVLIQADDGGKAATKPGDKPTGRLPPAVPVPAP